MQVPYGWGRGTIETRIHVRTVYCSEARSRCTLVPYLQDTNFQINRAVLKRLQCLGHYKPIHERLNVKEYYDTFVVALCRMP